MRRTIMSNVKTNAELEAAISQIEIEVAKAVKDADAKNAEYQAKQEELELARDRNSTALRNALISNQNLVDKHQTYSSLLKQYLASDSLHTQQ